MRTLVTAARLLSPAGVLLDPLVAMDGERIVGIWSRAERPIGPAATVYDFPGATIAPAFFDLHLHGGAGRDVMEATPESLAAIGDLLARHGTARYLATTVSAPLDATLKAVSGLAKLIAKPETPANSKPCAQPIGIHLEGPFLSHAKRGVQPAEHLLPPDIAIFDRLYEAAEGHVRLMTIAPELPGAVDLIAHATRRGVRVSLGHSDASAEQTLAAIEAGAINTTHTFNGMRPFDHRDPGILGTVLTDDRIYAELICDGVHVSPAAVKLWWKVKGEERAILVTDAISATGMPDGEYTLGGFPVQVANGRAMARGVLAGSVLTLDRAVENFVAFTGASVGQAVRLASANPAKMLGSSTPELANGEPADLIAVDEQGKLLGSIVGGRISH